jgi:hypothetical protein
VTVGAVERRQRFGRLVELLGFAPAAAHCRGGRLLLEVHS